MHIPKCGGISFRNTLFDNYPDEVYIYHPIRPAPLYKGFKVIHGHFPMRRLADKYADAKKITWVRHPVDRIISLYNFWKEIGHQGINEEGWDLIDVASQDFLKSEMQYFFDGFDFDDFYFIGVLENFNNDLNILAENLGWNSVNLYHKNRSGGKKDIFKNEKEKLTSILKDEILLYSNILKYRKLNVFK